MMILKRLGQLVLIVAFGVFVADERLIADGSSLTDPTCEEAWFLEN